ANMKFRLYTVQPDEFDAWAKHQASPAVFSTTPAPVTTPVTPVAQVSGADSTAPTPATTAGYVFPRERLETEFPHVIPQTPIPAGLTFDDALLAGGDPARGANEGFMLGGCIGCHAISGVPGAVSEIGPNLTHIASRHTIAGGLYKNDAPTLARWIKNARHMKPGSLMNTIGRGEYDPILKTTNTGGLDDRQIADVVAYLMALK
ncbi:MAG: c-type cytochrome, partial [Gemmatimonadota bacterium]